MQSIIAELGNMKSRDFGPKPGGFNILNVPDELYVNAEQFWRDFNKPWLDAAIARGDKIVFATQPRRDLLWRPNLSNGTYELSGFGREYYYLLNRGLASRL